MEYSVVRELNYLFIIVDISFLLLFGFLLLRYNRKMAFLFGITGAIIYFIVDYGIFYTLLGTREVVGANTFWFLLWLSTSYGFTNFIWIWLFLEKDKRILNWSVFIVLGWLIVAFASQLFGDSFGQIRIARGVGSYHTYMLIILLVGYGIVLYQNIKHKRKIPVLYLLFVGILVQFSWEAVLLISGVRPLGFAPIVINSLLETNLGLPYLYFIHLFLTSRQQLTLVEEG